MPLGHCVVCKSARMGARNCLHEVGRIAARQADETFMTDAVSRLPLMCTLFHMYTHVAAEPCPIQPSVMSAAMPREAAPKSMVQVLKLSISFGVNATAAPLQ